MMKLAFFMVCFNSYLLQPVESLKLRFFDEAAHIYTSRESGIILTHSMPLYLYKVSRSSQYMLSRYLPVSKTVEMKWKGKVDLKNAEISLTSKLVFTENNYSIIGQHDFRTHERDVFIFFTNSNDGTGRVQVMLNLNPVNGKSISGQDIKLSYNSTVINGLFKSNFKKSEMRNMKSPRPIFSEVNSPIYLFKSKSGKM